MNLNYLCILCIFVFIIKDKKEDAYIFNFNWVLLLSILNSFEKLMFDIIYSVKYHYFAYFLQLKHSFNLDL